MELSQGGELRVQGVGVLAVGFFPVAPEVVAPCVMVGGVILLEGTQGFLGTFVKGAIFLLSVGDVVGFGDVY